jgi:ABC-type transport system involved in multi-copper enzyme maturation permease subunit
MTWLAFRQFRFQVALAAVATVAVVVVLAATRHGIATNPSTVSVFQQSLRLLGTGLVGVPVVIGAFWGAPLVAREVETGTHLLAWTQSVTRARWLATKLSLVAATAVTATAVYGFAFTWWSSPLDGFGNRVGTANFGQRGIAPIGYTLFAVALGTVAGIVLKRTLPAIAATLTGFFVTRFTVQLFVRSHLLKPRTLSIPTETFGRTTNSQTAGAWILSNRTVDRAGQVVRSIDNLLADSCSLTRASSNTDFANCARKLGIRDIVTMHPANRFWELQAIETALFIGLAIALTVTAFQWIRRLP